MQKRFSLLQVGVLIMIAALIALAAGSQRVQAGVPAQETAEATETVEATEAATAAPTTDATADATGTAEGTAEPTPTPTIGGDEAYPPCPERPVRATAEATQATTEGGTETGAETEAEATATDEAADAADTTADATEAATPDATAAATQAATEAATDAASAATPMPAATQAETEAAAATAEGTAAAATAEATVVMQVTAFQSTNGCVLMAALSGANEVPNPGDPDAAGTAMLIITRPETGAGQICFRIESSGLTLPAAQAHIHAGPAGIAGKIVVPLSAPGEDGKAEGCTTGVERSLIKAILLYPDSYYVNVHTNDFPTGAVRGQLVGQ